MKNQEEQEVHRTTRQSPFEVVYGFNPFTPLDLIPLPLDTSFIHKEGVSRSEFVKKLHDKVRNQIKVYAAKGSRGRKELVLNEGDWVWLHVRKDRFPTKRKSKLSPEVMALSSSWRGSTTMLIG